MNRAGTDVPQPKQPGIVRRFFANLGPGLITGAADDDPSGISTYSVAGAAFGYSFLWTALLTFPLMAAIQLMCARLGMVSGRGLAAAIRLRYPKWVLWPACLLLIVANVFNIGADLGGMADVMQMVTGIRSYYWTPFFALLISALLIWTSYNLIARVFKWLTLVLFAYVITAFLARPDWGSVFSGTFMPHVAWTQSYMSVLVGILGTTISPYLFFWQAAEEVEEDRKHGKTTVAQRRGSTNLELRAAREDVFTGMFFSNLVMFFIILTTALTLHRHGILTINTTRDAATALRPLAGNYAYFLYTLGIVGTGLLAIPTLAGSAAYAIAETFDWAFGLDERFENAVSFYSIFILSTVVGAALDFLNVDPIKALLWSAIINGVLAPFVLVALLLVASDPRIMHGQVSSRLTRVVVALTTLLMFGAAIGMFIF